VFKPKTKGWAKSRRAIEEYIIEEEDKRKTIMDRRG
jgi:hypothetical protein